MVYRPSLVISQSVDVGVKDDLLVELLFEQADPYLEMLFDTCMNG